MGTVLKREGRVLNVNKDTDQKVLEVSTDLPEKASVTKDNKISFDDFKVLYGDMIKEKCLETYGTCDDSKLLEDTAKELFLKSTNYIPNENEKVDAELEKKTESVRQDLIDANVEDLTTGDGEDWIVFYLGDKELCSYTFRGTFDGELPATIKSLAQENGVKPEDITVKAITKKIESKRVINHNKLKESKNNEFSSTKFEKELPYQMRWKHWEKVNTNDLYWVTQEFFDKNMMESFVETFKETNFDKAYVTTRDLSHYEFEKDLENEVFVVVNNDGSFDMKNYIDAVHSEFPDYPENYFESKNIKVESNELYVYTNADSYDKQELEGNLYNYEMEAPNLTFKVYQDNGMYFVQFIGRKQEIIDYLTKLGWYEEDEIEKLGLIKPYNKVENKDRIITQLDDLDENIQLKTETKKYKVNTPFGIIDVKAKNAEEAIEKVKAGLVGKYKDQVKIVENKECSKQR